MSGYLLYRTPKDDPKAHSASHWSALSYGLFLCGVEEVLLFLGGLAAGVHTATAERLAYCIPPNVTGQLPFHISPEIQHLFGDCVVPCGGSGPCHVWRVLNPRTNIF
jgi:hypothetical protein